MSWTTRTPLVLLLAFASAGLLATGCGEDDPGGSASASTPAAAGSFPLVVEHTYGSTEITGIWLRDGPDGRTDLLPGLRHVGQQPRCAGSVNSGAQEQQRTALNKCAASCCTGWARPR